MRLWQAPARALPVTARPVGGETVVSYARRLSVANDLPPTTVLRALGQFTGKGSGKHLLSCDALLNEHAAGRLETYTGISSARLAHALPALRVRPHPGQAPADRPALRFHRAYTRPPCRQCALAAADPGGPDVLLLQGWTPLACRRHRRWLGLADETSQYDLSPARDILTAARRLTGLLAHSGDLAWADREFLTAWNMTQAWTSCGPPRMPVFSQRWRGRATALGITHNSAAQPPRVVTFPEAVTLTGILTDLDWRRDVALASWTGTRFYQRIAESAGEQTYPRWFPANDPVRYWIRYHRARFEHLRPWPPGKPPPENRHFK